MCTELSGLKCGVIRRPLVPQTGKTSIYDLIFIAVTCKHEAVMFAVMFTK